MGRFLLFLATTLLCLPLSAEHKPVRPHILGIDEVQIMTTDLANSLDYYSKTLNLAREEFTLPGTVFFLNPFQDIYLRAAPVPAPANFIAQITFSTDDAPGLRRYLVSRNVEVSQSNPNYADYDYYFTVVDPEGHRIGFSQRRQKYAEQAPSKPGAPPPPSKSTFRLIHAGIIVRDHADEDRFYKDILGFHVYWYGGMKEGEDNWVDMQVPDGTDWIEYMLNVPANADKYTLGVMNYIALGVPDIRAAEQKLRANGWNGTEEPKIGRDGKWQLNLYDPDGTRVEFMEFTPVQKPCCSDYAGLHPKP